MKTFKRILALCLALSLALQLLPAAFALDRPAGEPSSVSAEPASAAEAALQQEPVPAEEIASDQAPAGERIYGMGLLEDELPDYAEADPDAAAGRTEVRASLPAHYDSRDSGIITPVRDQGAYGTCWAHATLASIETYMLKNHITDASTGMPADGNINLSEYHLAWFTYTTAYDRLELLKGDTTTATPGENEESYLDVGGNALMACDTMMRGEGPASENVTALKYSNASPNGLAKKYAYTENAVRVTDMDIIPYSSPDQVKQLLMERGAGTLYYYHDNAYLNESEGAYCFIQSVKPGEEGYHRSNHAITLVGWDDNYPVEKFRSGHRPTKKGAWICKGSWGTDRGKDGYFYVSYEDTVSSNNNAYFYKADEADRYDNIYQYDGTISPLMFPSAQKTMRTANVFTSVGNERLDAVSVMTAGTDLSYKVRIYTELRNSDPTSGVLQSTNTGTIAYSGAHTIPITPVFLHPNETYSVVVELTRQSPYSSGTYFSVYYDASVTMPKYATVHSARPNVSYYSTGTNWYQVDNGAGTFRIKAYTVNIDPEYLYGDYKLTKGVYAQIPLDPAYNTGGHSLYKLSVLSGSLPEGMATYEYSDYAEIIGTPMETGQFRVAYAVLREDLSLVYYVIYLFVASDTAEPSSELVLLPCTYEVNRTLSLSSGGRTYFDVDVSSGVTPPGMDLSWSSTAAPRLYGAPHKTGTNTFDVAVTFEDSSRLEHRVTAIVYNYGTPLKTMTIDLSHGEFRMTKGDYNSHLKTTISTLTAGNQLSFYDMSNGMILLDLDLDGTYDVMGVDMGDWYSFLPVVSGSLRRDHSFSLTEADLSALSGRSDYAKELKFHITQTPIPSYTMDLNFAPKEMPLEEYMSHLLWPLGVMARDGMIGSRSEGTTSWLDLDNDGTDDVVVELNEKTARFTAADTNSLTNIRLDLNAAQRAELAETCSALSIRILLPDLITRYPVYVNNVQVTSRNRGDILGNGVFSFNGTNLEIHGSCTLQNGIYSEMQDLRIFTAEDSVLTVTGMGIELRKDAMLWGPGKLTLRDCRVGIYLNTADVRLQIYYTEVHVSGLWGIAGETRNEHLTVDNATVFAHGDRGAICDLGGGISIRNAKLTEPANASVGSTAILDANGEPAVDTVIYSIRHFNPFVDVKEGAYYYDPVIWAFNRTPQITTGTDATHFSPKRICTRAQVVTFLWRANGSPDPETASCPFTDVKASAFYYKAVLWAVENGITSGATATSFAPDRACTREQVVTFLWRARGCPEPHSTTNPFTDVSQNSFAYQAILWAVEEEITTGVGEASFNPKGECTRGQIVTFLYRDYGPKG